MNSALKWSRKILLVLLLVLLAVWTSSEYEQWAVRLRGQHLLADIRSLNMDQSTWADAQRVISKWSEYGSSAGKCTANLCNYRITLVQSLPQFFIGYPDKGIHNWLPRILAHLGMRSAAARGGFTVQRGVVISKWFAEQVSLPVSAWGAPNGAYVPDLAISSGEFPGFPPDSGPPVHPYRRVRDWGGPYGITVHFVAQEDPAEQARLMDFQFACITRFTPCRSEGDILPEAWRMLQEQDPTLRSR